MRFRRSHRLFQLSHISTWRNRQNLPSGRIDHVERAGTFHEHSIDKQFEVASKSVLIMWHLRYCTSYS